MVIYDLGIKNIAVLDAKANAPLIVYADAPLTFAVPAQGLKSIAWRSTHVFERKGVIQHLQLPLGNSGKSSELSRGFAFEQCLGVLAMEGLYHPKQYNATR